MFCARSRGSRPEHEGAGLDDPDPEPLGAPLERRQERGVLRARALEHEGVPPLPGDEELHEAVREHGVVRGDVEEMRLALLLAKPVIERGQVEEQEVAPPGPPGQGIDGLAGGVDEEAASRPPTRAC